MSSGGNPKRNHHVVPAFYLKGFAEKLGEPFVWMYKKGYDYVPGGHPRKSNPARVSVRTAGMERDFYAEMKPDGTVDFESYENLLESFEKPADRVFQKIRDRQNISEEEKLILSEYIAQMMKRTVETRDWVEKNLPRLLEGRYDDAELMARIPGANIEEKHSILAAALDRVRSDPHLARNTHLRILPLVPDAQSINVINQMAWCFWEANSEQRFVAGDNPVFIFKHLGLLKPDSELSFPISSRVALWASTRRNIRPGFQPAPNQLVKEFNRRTAQNAARHLYASGCEDWIVDLLNKKRHRLSLLR